MSLTRRFALAITLIAATAATAGEIALTFDDAPLPDSQYYDGYKRTKVMLRKLEQLNIDQVAFFTTTKHIVDETAERRLRLIGEAGHLLGNHTHSHQRIHRLGADAYIDDIRLAHKQIEKLPGFRPWFRYPFLDEGGDRETRDKIRNALTEMGYTDAYVTVDNYEWYLNQKFQQALMKGQQYDMRALRRAYVDLLWNSVLFYDELAKKVLGRSPKHVLLLHDNDLTAICIQDLVRRIRSEGWTIISPTEAYADPLAQLAPDAVGSSQGRISAIARDRRYNGALKHESEDRSWIDRYLKKNRVFLRFADGG